ncbi:MAG: phenylalanine--tRNA ligase subunit beta, partial [Thermodesulfobacteriota bacterium]|nr:phenylalanine--tRNA ligase subunit beta [Thermodesulfobacteriota bacterium]
MLLSLNWLREFVPYEGSEQVLADKLTMLGLEVEEVLRPFEGLSGVVVGHVLECGPHPEADRLKLCQVDVGEPRLLSIVCGAPNVAAGQKVAVAKVGTDLPSGIKVKKAKLRGQVSLGMICAEDELGLGEDHEGILVLDPKAKSGGDLFSALNLDEVVFDVSVTPNRADCLSVLGLAREVALAFELPLRMPEFTLAESGGDAASEVEIQIDEPRLCPAYRARIIQDVKVAPSPEAMRYRLTAVGMRPINNIVDVTNYVMMELGQPLHAFDRSLLKGKKIRVARAEGGMAFTTLDAQDRKLVSSDLLIWDAERPVALAGVMGGADSEMHELSTEVLLESAVFNPISIRKTARRLALPSESSYRFERGVDQVGSRLAVDRAAGMMAELSGGLVMSGVAVAEPLPWKGRRIDFRPSRAKKFLGIPVDPKFCRNTLKGMDCEVKNKEAEKWEITAPSHRLDLEREEDLIEEVARVYGMDRIPTVLPRIHKSLEGLGQEDTAYEFSMKLRRWAMGAGLSEAVNYSFVGQDDLDLFKLPREDRVAVKNPLSEDQNVLRTALAPGLLQNLRHNLAQGNARLRLFEQANVYFADHDSETTAQEQARLGLVLYGGRHRDVWPFSAEDADYSDLKGLVEHLLGSLGLSGAGYVRKKGHAYLKPCVEVVLEGITLGEIGRVMRDLAGAYHARKDVWLAEMDADKLKELYENAVCEFKELPKLPPVRRDLTVVAAPDLSAVELTNAAKNAHVNILEDVALVDVFEPEDGTERKLTLRLTYRHPKRTLKDREVDKIHGK